MKKVGLSVFIIVFSFGFAVPAFALDEITRVSVADDGSQANSNSFNSDAVSADGRYVVFSSNASNLVLSDTNSNYDVFVHDTQTGDVELISVNSSEVQDATGYSSFPSISDDGRYVVFRSSADDLVSPQTTTGQFNIYLRDRTSGTTEIMSVDASGNEGDDNSFTPVISGDGSTVAFLSSATNLVAGDGNAVYDVFVRAYNNEASIERVSVDTLGADSNGASYTPAISEDGTYVVFRSLATELDAGCLGAGQTYVRNTIANTTNCVSVVGSTVQTEANSGSYQFPSISADGRYVSFTTGANNLDPTVCSNNLNIFVRDTVDETTTCVSTNVDGVEGDGDSYYGTISADGTHVVFVSEAGNLVADDTEGNTDVFVKKISTGEVVRVTVNTNGDGGNEDSVGQGDSFPAITEGGEYVVFSSGASNLISTGMDTNLEVDVFITPVDFGSTGSASSSRGVSRMRLFGYLNSKKAQLPTCSQTLPDCIRTVQSFLISNGFGVGMPVDGIKGPLTIGALTGWFAVNK